jgi:phosphopantetheinyl transferase (holo-ACP synthase)
MNIIDILEQLDNDSLQEIVDITNNILTERIVDRQKKQFTPKIIHERYYYHDGSIVKAINKKHAAKIFGCKESNIYSVNYIINEYLAIKNS